MFDFCATPCQEAGFKLADIEASNDRSLITDSGQSSSFFVSPYMIEKGDGIHDPGPGVPGQPLVVPDLEVGIPVQE